MISVPRRQVWDEKMSPASDELPWEFLKPPPVQLRHTPTTLFIPALAQDL